MQLDAPEGSLDALVDDYLSDELRGEEERQDAEGGPVGENEGAVGGQLWEPVLDIGFEGVKLCVEHEDDEVCGRSHNRPEIENVELLNQS